MLDSLRGFATTWMGKLLGALLLVGLAGFGVTGVLTGIGTNNVANVGSQEITIRDFQRVYNSLLNNVAATTGAIPTPQQAVAFGLPTAAINQLANQAALTDMGRDFGLGVSDERLGKIIRDDPSFGGVLGSFEEANFQRVLEQNGYTQNEYFADQTDAARRQQISIALFAGMTAPKTSVDLINRYSTDTRTIDYFVLGGTAIETPDEPTPAEIEAYLSENQSQYRTQPTRNVEVMVLSPQALVQGINIADADIAADYERTKANYTKPATRTVSQAILSSDFLVDLFEDGLVKGKSFDQMIEETSIPVTDLGTLSRAQITDEALGDAAFDLAEGEYSLIRAAQGIRAVSVSNVDPGGQQSLDEVRDQITEKLKLRQARDEFIDVLDQIEELRAAFRPLDEIAGRFGLVVTELDVTANGDALDAIAAIPQDSRSRVASAIFSVEEGNLAPTVTLGANLNVWFDLKSITTARDQTVEEVGDEVRQLLMDERIDAALSTLANDIVDEINAGSNFADAAAARSLFPQLSQAFGRRGDGSAVIDAQVASAAYGGGPGYVGSARNSDEDYVVFQVVDISNSGDEVQPETVDFVDRAVLDGLYQAFVTSVREDIGISINENVLTQVLALDGTQ